MTRCRCVRIAVSPLVLCLLAFVSQTSLGQSSTAPNRDASAVQVVNQALTAMGGLSAWAKVLDTLVTGNCLAVAKKSISANVRWTTLGPEFRYETDTDNGGPIYLSAHGLPKLSASAETLKLNSSYRELQQPFHMPGLPLERALNNSAVRMRFLGEETLSGVPAVHVRFEQTAGGIVIDGFRQDWWFDPAKGLPLRVLYLLPSQSDGIFIPMSWDFAGWSQEGTLIVPHQVVQSLRGDRALQGCNILSVAVNVKPATTLFDAR